jgi:hypothetical protein
MIRVLVLILCFPALLWAGEKIKDKEEVTYPTRDTAVRNGIKYRLEKSSNIYEIIDRAKDLKEKK